MALEIKFKSCCEECEHRCTYLHERPGSVKGIVTIIGCEHEQVCREYLESIEKKLNEEVHKLPVVEPIIVGDSATAAGVCSILNTQMSDNGFLTLFNYYDLFSKFDTRCMPVPDDVTDEELKKYGWDYGEALFNRRIAINCLNPDVYEIRMSRPIKYLGGEKEVD